MYTEAGRWGLSDADIKKKPQTQVPPTLVYGEAKWLLAKCRRRLSETSRYIHPTPFGFDGSTRCVSFLYFLLWTSWSETKILVVNLRQGKSDSRLEFSDAQRNAHRIFSRSIRFDVSTYRERGIDLSGQPFSSSTSALVAPVSVILRLHHCSYGAPLNARRTFIASAMNPTEKRLIPC